MAKRFLSILVVLSLLFSGAFTEENDAAPIPYEEKNVEETVLEDAPLKAPVTEKEDEPDSNQESGDIAVPNPSTESDDISVPDTNIADVPEEEVPESSGNTAETTEAVESAEAPEINTEDGILLLPADEEEPVEPVAGNASVTASINRASAVLCPNDSWTQLEVLFSDDHLKNDDGSERTVEFKSSNSKIVTVADDGILTGHARGKATVSAIVNYEGRTETINCAVSVLRTPSKLTLSPAKATLDIGGQNKYKVSFPKDYGCSVHFSSSDEDVAVIDEFGVVTAVGKGTAVITATAFSGKQASQSLTVYSSASSILLDDAEVTLGTGMQATVKAALPEFERDTLHYSSSDPEVVEIDDSGVVTAIAPGTADIKVRAEKGCVEADCSVTVIKGPDSIALADTVLKLGKGNTFELLSTGFVTLEPDDCMTRLKFETSSKRIVTVDANGNLKAVRTGSATITVSSSNGLSEKIAVTVSRYPSSLSLNTKTMTLGVNMNARLTPKFSKKSYSLIRFTSSNPDVVEVDAETGVLTAKSIGTAVITCACTSGKRKATCAVTVLGAPETIGVRKTFIDTYEGQTGVAAAGTYPGGTMCSFSYALKNSEDATYLDIDPSTGAINPKSACASAVIVVSASNSAATAECEVHIAPAPSELCTSDEIQIIGVGNTLSIVDNGLVSLLPTDAATDFTFSSSSKRIATVSSAGVIKGVRTGKATITVKTANGLTGSVNVQVMAYPSVMKLDTANLTLSPKMKHALKVTFGKNTYSLYRFTSSDPGIASVDPVSGLVTAVSTGKATITCSCSTGRKKVSCAVTVTEDPAGVEFNNCSYEVTAGDTASTAVHTTNGVPADLTYSSAVPDIVSIDQNGVITGIRAGETTITVTTHNGFTNENVCAVTVFPTPTAIIPESDSLTVGVGNRASFGFVVEPSNARSTYSYAIANTKVATVSKEGVVTGMAAGTTELTITSADPDVYAVMEIHVVPYCEVNNVDSIAHRGASGKYPPGNSITAFSHAAELGAKQVELDVQKSRDGILLVRHDTSITVNGTATAIASMTYSAICKADKNVCKLEEALNCLGKYDIDIMIEMKATGIASQVMACAKKCGVYDRCSYGSFNYDTLKAVKKADKSATTVYIMSKDTVINSALKNASDPNVDWISMYYAKLTEAMCRTFHLAGKKVAAWTINSASVIKAVKKLGVDAIITDYPDLV